MFFFARADITLSRHVGMPHGSSALLGVVAKTSKGFYSLGNASRGPLISGGLSHGRSYSSCTMLSSSPKMLQKPPQTVSAVSHQHPPELPGGSGNSSSASLIPAASSPLESVPLAVILAVQPYTTMVGPGLQIYFQYQPQNFSFQRIPFFPLASRGRSSPPVPQQHPSRVTTFETNARASLHSHSSLGSAVPPGPLGFDALSSALSALYAHRCLASLATFATSTLRELRHSSVRQKAAPLPDFWKRVGVLDTFYGTNYAYPPEGTLTEGWEEGAASPTRHSLHHPCTAAVELCRGSHRQELDVRITLYEEEPPGCRDKRRRSTRGQKDDDALSRSTSTPPLTASQTAVPSRHPVYRLLSTILLTGPSGLAAVKPRESGEDCRSGLGSETTSFSSFIAQQRRKGGLMKCEAEAQREDPSDGRFRGHRATATTETPMEARSNLQADGDALDWLVGQPQRDFQREGGETRRTLRGGLFPTQASGESSCSFTPVIGDDEECGRLRYVSGLPHQAGFKATGLFYYVESDASSCCRDGEELHIAERSSPNSEKDIAALEAEVEENEGERLLKDEGEVEDEVVPPWCLLPVLSELCQALDREGHLMPPPNQCSTTPRATSAPCDAREKVEPPSRNIQRTTESVSTSGATQDQLAGETARGKGWWMCAYQYSYFQDVRVGERFEVLCAPPRYFSAYRMPPWKTRIGAPPSIGITSCVALRAEVRQNNEVALVGTFFFYPNH